MVGQIHCVECTKCKYKFTTFSGGVIFKPANMTCPKCGYNNDTKRVIFDKLKEIFK